MLAKIFSGAVYGVDAYTVEIEVNTGRGDTPTVVVVGLPDAAVKESKDRVWTALINSGFGVPFGRTTINLAPADIKKEGPSFDLPIAIGTLVAEGALDPAAIEGVGMTGELALSGEIRRVNGVLPVALHMKAQGFRRMLVPTENAEEAAVVEGLEVIPVATLREAADFLAGEHPIEPLLIQHDTLFQFVAHDDEDFSDVKGQESTKRALEVAIAGGHNILLIGSPGAGKSMIAKRVPSIFPPMSLDEALESTKIHSIAGRLPPHQAIISQRPFRAPHHTISDAGLLGGGSHPMPGEVSLAHHGVLFLDELPEFARNVLEVMRQPLEDGVVTISRAAASVTFPCRFMLVAAMNPCPCGYYGDLRKECRCTQQQIMRYRNKISGPLLDRIDIHVEVPAVRYEDLANLTPGESSQIMRERIIAARETQQRRYAAIPGVHCNAGMRPKDIEAHCELEEETRNILKMAIADMNFSARAYTRILKVARTIADMEHAEIIGTNHISEAIQYRSLDRQLW